MEGGRKGEARTVRSRPHLHLPPLLQVLWVLLHLLLSPLHRLLPFHDSSLLRCDALLAALLLVPPQSTDVLSYVLTGVALLASMAPMETYEVPMNPTQAGAGRDALTCNLDTLLATVTLNPGFWRLSNASDKVVPCRKDEGRSWSPCVGGTAAGKLAQPA